MLRPIFGFALISIGMIICGGLLLDAAIVPSEFGMPSLLTIVPFLLMSAAFVYLGVWILRLSRVAKTG
ncbi:hypothetical protein [Pararhizobium sp.]|uniref:hypothetical protein n=1 Tax=Pararhizobium sp. TaxID=1977563 RepID=UPI0027214FC3|nr:hypothetical protein [Pararhizobium sp.]MDO9416044.1 hypothetical protein [Pararhizobium sp.]